MTNQILIIEDDIRLADRLAKGLMEANYDCLVASTGKEAEKHLTEQHPDLVLLDMNLPDTDGSELLKFIRQATPDLPVIVATARTRISDRVSALESGADDYLIKPYAFEELLARIRIQMRHSERISPQESVGDLVIDHQRHIATRAGERLDLTPKEFELLAFLASLKGETASRQMLQEEVWNVKTAMTSMDNVIDVFISRLRQKLDPSHRPPLLHTIRGVGFVLREKK